MNKKDKEEMQTILAETLNKNIVPVLEKLDKRTDKMRRDVHQIKERLTNVEMGVDSLNRKFDAQQDRLDRHDKRIQSLESASL